jgi:hypothetical protein
VCIRNEKVLQRAGNHGLSIGRQIQEYIPVSHASKIFIKKDILQKRRITWFSSVTHAQVFSSSRSGNPSITKKLAGRG